MNRSEYISDNAVVKRAREAVRIELEKKHAMDIPIVSYDRSTGNIYNVFPDGHKELIGKRSRKGRLSER